MNPTDAKWQQYGGRGITVCDRWRSFQNFLADMGERPAGTTLDRYPNKTGNYEPGNCRWATAREQANNKTNNRLVVAGGKIVTAAEAARLLGVCPKAYRKRLARAGATRIESV